jgi:predicted transcriptional regulator
MASTTNNNADNIRSKSALQVVRLIRRAGLTQQAIAKRVGCSQTFVSHTIHGYGRPSDLSERVWKTIERATRGRAA